MWTTIKYILKSILNYFRKAKPRPDAFTYTSIKEYEPTRHSSFEGGQQAPPNPITGRPAGTSFWDKNPKTPWHH
jgi:hypothetical protein